MDNFLCIFRPCILKAEKKVGFVSIEESFDTTFNMGYSWEGESSPPPPSLWYQIMPVLKLKISIFI